MPWTLESFVAGDGYRWHYRHYPAIGTPRGTVVCLHGIQSHAGWYERSCEELAAASFEVFFLDRRGAGSNTQDRGDTLGFRRLLDDIAEFLRAQRQSSPGQPIVLLAISWGGKIAAALQRRHPGLIDGMALLCPGFCPMVGLPFLTRLRVLASRLFAPRRLFDVPLSDPGLFTASPEGIQFIREDPLAVRRATARFLLESARLDGYLRWFPPKLTMPVLLLLTEKDRIIDNQQTRALIARLAGANVQVIEYPGSHHTLEFEPPPRRFIADLIEWLERVPTLSRNTQREGR